MSGKNTAVFGIYPTHESAGAAVDALRTKGFRNTDISVLFPQNVGSKEFGHEPEPDRRLENALGWTPGPEGRDRPGGGRTEGRTRKDLHTPGTLPPAG